MRDYALAKGASCVSYHFAPTLYSQTAEPVIVSEYGFKQSWMDLYNKTEFRQHDPLPDLIMARGVPTTWDDAIKLRQLNQKEKDYVSTMHDYGLVHGMGIPLFGPLGRDAYSSVSFHDNALMEDRSLISRLSFVWQTAHVKLVRLLDRKKAKRIALSSREMDVLRLMAAGKSKTVIADRLELTPASVDTYSRRLFAKLDVNDRVGATVRAISLGILKL